MGEATCTALLPAQGGTTTCSGALERLFVMGQSGVFAVDRAGLVAGDLYACASCARVTFAASTPPAPPVDTTVAPAPVDVQPVNPTPVDPAPSPEEVAP